jgi:hypothetical protein
MCFLSDWWEAAVLFFTLATLGSVPPLRGGFPVSRLISGGNRSPRSIGGMRRGQNSTAYKSLKRPGREPWNGRKDIKVVSSKALTHELTPGVL